VFETVVSVQKSVDTLQHHGLPTIVWNDYRVARRKFFSNCPKLGGEAVQIAV
jgi:hypothetical protein